VLSSTCPFNGYGGGEIAQLIDLKVAVATDVMGEQLQRRGRRWYLEVRIAREQVGDVLGVFVQLRRSPAAEWGEAPILSVRRKRRLQATSAFSGRS
jgi:hypothetical protein